MIWVYKRGNNGRMNCLTEPGGDYTKYITELGACSFQQVTTQYRKSHEFFLNAMNPNSSDLLEFHLLSCNLHLSLSWENVKVVTYIYCILRTEDKVHKVQKLPMESRIVKNINTTFTGQMNSISPVLNANSFAITSRQKELLCYKIQCLYVLAFGR